MTPAACLIEEGSAKLSRLSHGNAAKTGNTTGTAVHYRHPVYNVDDTKVTVHLGNNGLRTEKTPTGTLTVKVNTTTGSSAPSSEAHIHLHAGALQRVAGGNCKWEAGYPDGPCHSQDRGWLRDSAELRWDLPAPSPARPRPFPVSQAGTAYQLTETAIAGDQDTYQKFLSRIYNHPTGPGSCMTRLAI